jgi:ferredoxin
MKSALFLIAVVLAMFSPSNAFQSRQPRRIKGETAKSSSTALEMTVLTYNGKKRNFKPGSPLKSAASALGVKPKYSCRKGDCGSCTLSVGGQRIKACVGKVPDEPRLKSLQEKGLEIK